MAANIVITVCAHLHGPFETDVLSLQGKNKIFFKIVIYFCIKKNLPENMDMVNSGRNWASCFDKNLCDRQYSLQSNTSNVPTLSSSGSKLQKVKNNIE